MAHYGVGEITDTIAAFTQVKLQTGATVFRVGDPTGLAWTEFSSIREPFLWWVDIWTLVVTYCILHGPQHNGTVVFYNI